jgi:hypothetical protein
MVVGLIVALMALSESRKTTNARIRLAAGSSS